MNVFKNARLKLGVFCLLNRIDVSQKAAKVTKFYLVHFVPM